MAIKRNPRKYEFNVPSLDKEFRIRCIIHKGSKMVSIVKEMKVPKTKDVYDGISVICCEKEMFDAFVTKYAKVNKK